MVYISSNLIIYLTKELHQGMHSHLLQRCRQLGILLRGLHKSWQTGQYLLRSKLQRLTPEVLHLLYAESTITNTQGSDKFILHVWNVCNTDFKYLGLFLLINYIRKVQSQLKTMNVKDPVLAWLQEKQFLNHRLIIISSTNHFFQ